MPKAVDADDAQVVILRDALSTSMPRTSAAASVFQMVGAGRKRPRARVVAPNPATLETIQMPAPSRRNPPSPWEAVFSALQPGNATPMTEEQALAFAAWGRAHGRKVRRRRIDGVTFAVWRE